MDGSGPREGGGGAMKPVILKVGVALVLSATGLILARFVSRKEDNELGFLRRELLAMQEEHNRSQDLVIVFLKLVS
ncbi:hypothetical protein F2Q69_00011121 [Brassica cretica]|uniref:Uncharacterized protein n=1 Tax=Brassica cretica TaxID=69181 RepID=A0A8S9R721_BRACR|nr:hypothetical protein F2Q69_00011121 [Brassica cretica]